MARELGEPNSRRLRAVALNRIADHATVTSECPNDVCPSHDVLVRANATNEESRTFGLASNVAFIAGAVLTTIGVVLFVTAPRRPRIVVGFGVVGGSF